MSNVRWNYEIRRQERRCTQCTVWMPEVEDNFSYNRGRMRFNSWCKPCVATYRRDTRAGAVSGGRRFGVEIEFLGNSRDLEREMNARGLNCRVMQYTHRVSQTEWKIVGDASVSGGAELVSPVLRGAAGRAAILKAGEALAAANCRVNRSTGLHVHHDVRNLRVSAFQRLITNWVYSQDAIDQLVAESRRNGHNQFCARHNPSVLNQVRRLTSMDQRHVSALMSDTRYRTLNVQSYVKYGTVEVRQHQGTVDGKKILAWIDFGQAMIKAAVDGTDVQTSDVNDMINALPLANDVKAYLRTRAAKLSVPHARRIRSTRTATATRPSRPVRSVDDLFGWIDTDTAAARA